jgi:ADP-heptose:LPS heptosyltransferase
VRRLLIRPGAIGDCLLTFPAMEALRAGYTEVWAPTVMKPLVQFADRVRAIADTGLDLVGIDDSPALSAMESFDEIVSWYGANRPEFREAVAHLPFRFFPALPPPPGEPRIAVPDVPRTKIVVHPFSASSAKNWPLDRFHLVVERLDAEWAVNRDGSPRIENLYELACWLRGARLYIGNDSGITHLAAAVGTPVVALFGPMDPAVWAPRTEWREILRGQPMETIAVDDVLAAARRLLARVERSQGDHAGRGAQSLRPD